MIRSHGQPLKDQFLLSEDSQSDTGVMEIKGTQSFMEGTVSGEYVVRE